MFTAPSLIQKPAVAPFALLPQLGCSSATRCLLLPFSQAVSHPPVLCPNAFPSFP